MANTILFMTELTVANLERAVAWYVDVLGLSLQIKDETRGFALLNAGAIRVALKERTDSVIAGVRLIFEVGDIDGEYLRLRSLDVERSEVTVDPEGFRSLKLVDPDGTPITLFAWIQGPG